MTEYYNNEIKREYLSTLKSPNLLASFFSTAKQFEEDANLDFGAMPDAKVIEIYESTNPVNLMSIKSQLPGINAYRHWYRERFDNWDRTDMVNLEYSQIDIPKAMENVFAKSWHEIMEELNAIDYDFRQGYETAPVLALIWLGYKMSEVVNLKEKQVDLKNGVIYDLNREPVVINMEPEILGVFQAYKDTTEAFRIRRHKEHVYMVQTGYFIHRMDTKNSKKPIDQPQTVNAMARQIKKAATDYEEKTQKHSKMDSINLLYAGQYYRLHEYLRQNPNRKNQKVQLDMKRIMGSPQISVKDIDFMHKKYEVAFDLHYGDNDPSHPLTLKL